MSVIGWIHTGFGVCALVAGTAVVLRPKGTRRHRLLGRLYVGSMVGLLGTAFMIYRLFEGFGVFHWAAVLGLLTLAAGFGAARLRRSVSGWLEPHYYFMGYSYVGLLAATGAEVATRVPGAAFAWAAGGASVVVTFAGAVVIHSRASHILPRIRRSGRIETASEGEASPETAIHPE